MANDIKILSNLDLQGNSLDNTSTITSKVEDPNAENLISSSISLKPKTITIESKGSVSNTAFTNISNTASEGSISNTADKGDITSKASEGSISNKADKGSISNTANNITNTAKETVEIISPEIHFTATEKSSSKIKIKWDSDNNSLIFFKG